MHRIGLIARACRVALVPLLFIGLFNIMPFSSPAANSVTLAWEPSTTTNVVGYKIYSGRISHSYTSVIDVGNTTNKIISGLAEGTNFFAITAYNTSTPSLESDFSNEVTNTVPISVGNQPPTISVIPNQTTTQNVSTAQIPFTIGDAETTAANLILYASSSNSPLVTDTDIVFSYGNNSNRTVTIIPFPNQSGNAAITITVSDGGSATSSTTFQLNVLPPPPSQPTLTLITNGYGAILSKQLLATSLKYTLTAVPAKGYVFAGWSRNSSSSAAKITLAVTSNLVVQANFIPSPFVPICGVYNGLFYEDDEVRQHSAGYFTVSPTTLGNFSGRLQMRGKMYGFSGRLNLQCQATNLVKRPLTNALTLKLRVGMGYESDGVFGQVTDGSWTSTLFGNRALFNAITNPSPYSGKYTITIPSQDVSMGNGCATVNVDAGGIAHFVSTLADGTKATQNPPLSKNGLWPLYVSLYSGGGSILGWLLFQNQATNDLNGLLSWIKPAAFPGNYYPAGFTNMTTAIGSRYAPPPIANRVINLTNASVAIFGGNLPSAFTNLVLVGKNNKVSNLSSNLLKMSFWPATGTFTGSTTVSNGQSLTFQGVVLQKLNAGYGFMLSTNQSSQVILSP